MNELILSLCLLAMFAVPMSLCLTVQYCVHIERDLSFAKLLLFSWTLAIIFFPFSLVGTVGSLYSYAVGNIFSFDLLTVIFSYIIFGWLICSALYGKLIVPKLSGNKLNLP